MSVRPDKGVWNRRQFIRTAGSAATVRIAGAASARGVSLLIEPNDPVANSAPVEWAALQLAETLAARGITLQRCQAPDSIEPGNLAIAASGSTAPLALGILKRASLAIADAPESLGLVPGFVGKRSLLLATGRDARALVFALLDLADRVRYHDDALLALTLGKPSVERPANSVRAVTRMFTSDVEDKPWYNDREMWPEYLTMLATQRFNRFHLAFGIGYDFIRRVTDGYFLFAYPFLLNVPGYNVRVPQLPDAERDNNLAMLRFISEQTVARGMEFQLGLWMHGYEWIDSPNPNYTIEGLDRNSHGPYCRDAVRMLLKACPAISGITFRVHGESGVEEGSYEFWKVVFDGVATCGRKVEIDMHAKGLDQGMLDTAIGTGQRVRVSPKFWAEHLGMPYHQADIRELEQPKPGKEATGLMKLSAGSRSFLRYGYGDLLRENRQWSVVHRVWPGTQRLLLWGDPLTAAAYSRAFSFCGSDGMDICEPLSFKGRRGSGIAGDRCAYADASLRTRWDWEKYVYGHRIWGRLAYNPECAPEVWQRYLRNLFGGGAQDMEGALSNASRILPIVTTAHGASAANNSYWPEIYLNQSLVDAAHPGPYTDSPAPKVFGNVSPFDPQLFSRINDFADESLRGEHSGKYSPIEAAQWIEDYAAAASAGMERAEVSARGRDKPEYRRAAIDISIQAGLGRFFAAKFRGAVLYRIYEQTLDRTALDLSLTQYRKARSAWAELAQRAGGVYMSDITVGETPQLRGHWLDRLPAIDLDIETIASKTSTTKTSPDPMVGSAIRAALERPVRVETGANHTPAKRFARAMPLPIALRLERPAKSVSLFYRHVNQAERYQAAAMNASGNSYHGTIPAAYTDSDYPLEYYFRVDSGLYPGLSRDLTRQPYFIVRPLKS